MRHTPTNRPLIVLVVGAVLLLVETFCQAQTITTTYTNQFNTAANAASWNYWYDLPQSSGSPLMGWASTNNNGGPAGSGSLPYFILWPGTSGGGQMQIYGTFAESGQYNLSQSLDPTKYDSVSFDIMVDSSSPTNSAGNIVTLTVGLFNNYSVYAVSNAIIGTDATNGWKHVVAPINKATAPTTAQGVGFNVNAYGGPNGPLKQQTNATKMWIDNIQVNRSKEVIPPPKMSSAFSAAEPGLNLYLNNQYDRTSLKLLTTFGLGWLGQPDTTYSFTITKFPDPAVYVNNQAHIFIATPDNSSAIDYNTTNLVWLNVQGNANGTATAYFRYKIFEDHQNTNLFGAEYTVGPLGTPWAGQLATLTASTAVGTWSMTFHQDTNVTMSGPGGVSTNFNIRPEVAAQFVDPLNVLFGAQPNNSPPATGQAVVLSHASITNSGGGVVLDDDFLADGGNLNTAIWTRSAAVAADVQLFPPDPGQKLVRWSTPDANFGLQVATNIAGPWTAVSGSDAATEIPTFALGGFRNGLVPSASLDPSQSFFRMYARKFTKLQVLLPGEFPDPGSATGKTGVPDPQTVGVPFNVIVNAVNPDWFPSPYASDHTVHISASGGSPTLPANADLTGGTATFSVTFTAAGNFTITANDVTDATKTADTSPSITVNP